MKIKEIKEKAPREPPTYSPTMPLEEEQSEAQPMQEDGNPKKQYKCFSLITYLPEDTMYLELCAHSKHIKRYAYAYHDQDMWVEDVYEIDKETKQTVLDENGQPKIKHKKGEPKEPHFHLILQLTQPRYPQAVANWFKEFNEENTLCQPCIGESVARTWKYLIHDSKKCREQGKVQYDASIRKSNDFTYFNRFDLPFNGDIVLNALLDLEAGFTVRECAMKYGRDFIINFHKIQEVLAWMNAEHGGQS